MYKRKRNWVKRCLDGNVNRRKKDGMFLEEHQREIMAKETGSKKGK